MWRDEANWPVEGHHDGIAARDKQNGEMVQEANPDHNRVAKSGLLAKVGLSYRQGGASVRKSDDRDKARAKGKTAASRTGGCRRDRQGFSANSLAALARR
jgi:hypothetical protein